ncbi:NmrA family NAD(P)-binding protein [Natrialbaceae archaeon AArc-T1-2]|uniref:NmrA family NAD(P)-binding protein n=1 Tax=Natrialbaceae archaeon AArc-T1-2 TaxID=3053904 RepID=UPI00255A9D39|nr:NmrA family NAD(P)-binding protein [Natrialbaceae archaeon AArc-T1-2]WIV67014.1 NmrA family NAD(P)-binding protein [Natrialbaceae archaeon AArc-T1-2]
MSTDTILVVGGTGNQGRAVIDRLTDLGIGDEIIALTRDASTTHAQATAELGAELVEGDLTEPETLRPHLERADKVWATINFWAVGYDAHIELGNNLGDAIETVGGLEHVVYSGAGDQQEETEVPHLHSHYVVSERLRETGVPYTALKPVYFMENWEPIGIEDGMLAFPLDEETHHHQTTYYDTARASAIALHNTDEFAGTAYTIASDLLTLDETAAVISDVTGQHVDPYHVPLEDAEAEFGEEFAVMCDHFINEGGHTSFEANIRRIERDFGFTPQTLEEYLRENGWEDGKDEPTHVPGWVKAMQ